MEYYIAIASIIGIHAMLGLSVYLVAISGQMSFGQQGFFALGAYLAGMSTALWGLHLLPALALGVVVAAVVGLLVGFPALRVRGLYLAIATFGFGEIVRLAFLNDRYTRRIGDRVVGPNASEGFRHVRYIYHDMVALPLAIASVTYPIFGGLGSFVGPLLGAVVLVGLTESLRALHDAREIIYGALIILTMLFRPRGLVDEALVLRVKGWLRPRAVRRPAPAP